MPASPSTAVSPLLSRDVSVDLLRAWALIAGVALHAAVPYLSTAIPGLLWPVHQQQGSMAADLIFWWGRCAQAQLFFFIAGLMAAASIERRGPDDFAYARLRRIGIPLLAGVVFVLPTVAAIWAWGWVETGRVGWDEVRSWKFNEPLIAQNAIGPVHLWFLVDLLIISMLFAAWRRLRLRVTQRQLPSSVSVAGLVGVAWLTLWLRPDVLFDARNTFIPDPARLAYGAAFFGCGVGLARHRPRVTQWPIALVMLAIAAISALFVSRLASQGLPVPTGNLAVASAATATGALSVIGAFVLAAGWRFSWPPLFQQLAVAGYPIYVIHLPIVGLAHMLLRSRTLDAITSIAMVTVGALAASLLLISAAGRVATGVRALVDRLQRVPAGAWTAAALSIGIALRVVQYARNPDVWLDEAALLVNVVEKDYSNLLGPLTYHEAAPPLFLWAERWIAVNLGDTPWLMRLLPLVASCLGLIAFIPMAKAAASRMAPLAMLLMATSINMIDHSAEAKSYAVDVCVAAGVASLFLITRGWSTTHRAAMFLMLAPSLIWISYPAVFVLAGVVVALAISARTEAQPSRLALITLAMAIALSITALWIGPIRAQRSPEILETWRWAFPAGFDPWSLVAWLARSAVGIADYCFRPFGGVLLISIAAGAAAFLRRAGPATFALLAAPLVLAAGAGLIGQYPFTGTRVMIFALPALAVFAAEGLGVISSRLPRNATLLQITVVAIVILPPTGLCIRELLSPSRRVETASASKLVLEHRRANELVASNQWEYRYYLRKLGSSFVALPETPLPLGQERLWLLVQGNTPDQRRARVTAGVGDFYRIVNTVELHGVSIMSLQANR